MQEEQNIKLNLKRRNYVFGQKLLMERSKVICVDIVKLIKCVHCS